MAKDYYDILGVARGASKDEIKRAYKKLAKQHHPDLNKDHGSEEKFKEINKAYATLSDDKKRAQYDQFGEQAENMGGGGFSDFAGFGGFGGGNFGDMFGDLFEGFFGGGQRRKAGSSAGADLRFDMDLTLEEAYHGVKKTIIIPKTDRCMVCKGSGAKNESDIVTCSVCKGSGMQMHVQRTPFGMVQQQTICSACRGQGREIKHPCLDCGGDGTVHVEKKVKIDMPAGVETGMRVRMSGEGEAGSHGGPSGDLYIICRVAQHDLFDRQGDDLITEVAVPFTMACLGGEIEVPTLDAEVTLKIPSGTKSNTLFRIRGKGMPHVQHSGHGSLLVRCVIDVPQKLSAKQKDLLKAFDGTLGQKKGLFSRIKKAFE